MKPIPILTAAILIPAAGLAEIHPEVQAALDWKLPPSGCEQPRVKQSSVIPDRNRKFDKAAKKYRKCMKKYHASLMKQHQEMMEVAKHGLTQEQAEIILGHMRDIQNVMVTSGQDRRPVNEIPVNADLFINDRH